MPLHTALSYEEWQVPAVYTVCRREVFARCGCPQRGYAPGARWTKVWRQVLALARDRRVDPITLVFAQFDRGIRGRLLEPNQLLSPEALVVLKGAQRAWSRQVTVEREIQERSLALRVQLLGRRHRQVAAERLQAEVLETESDLLPMGALFRCCQAQALGLRQLCESYLESAAYRYWPLRAVYDATWAGFIPVQLQAVAGRLFWKVIRRRLANGHGRYTVE